MEVIAYRSPHERRGDTAELGLLIGLGSMVMLFAALLFAYGVLRLHGRPQNLLVLGRGPDGLTLAAAVLGLRAVRRGRPRELSASLVIGLFCGLFSLAVGALGLWHVVPRLAGASPSEQLLGGILVLHSLARLVGCLGLAWLLMSSLDGRYSAASHLPVRLWVVYWLALVVIWILLQVSVWL